MGRVDESEARWQQEVGAILAGMQERRVQHPRATFRALEAALDERLGGMRARLLEDPALASEAADLRGQAAGGRPRGRHGRAVVTQGGAIVELERSYAVCPSCGEGLSPPG